ncbi:hypothetical protein ACWFR5_17175 [Streptomyces sp. NPDC055092]
MSFFATADVTALVKSDVTAVIGSTMAPTGSTDRCKPAQSVDPDAVYEITYEIHGDQSGPVIETAELSDRTSLNYTPSLTSTASASTRISVEITDVSAQGL